MATTNLDGTIIFDNGGGITLQFGDYAHYYGGYDSYIEQAAEDIHNYLQYGNTQSWDGHDEDAADLDPDYDEIRNGGYRVYSLADFMDLLDDDELDSWGNIMDLRDAVAKLLRD